MSVDIRYPNGANPDSKVYGANTGPTWALSAPGGPNVGPMGLAIWEVICRHSDDYKITHNSFKSAGL